MKEWKIYWAECPTAHNKQRVLFVQAETLANAREVAKDYIERKFGVARFVIDRIKETEHVPVGTVLEH